MPSRLRLLPILLALPLAAHAADAPPQDPPAAVQNSDLDGPLFYLGK